MDERDYRSSNSSSFISNEIFAEEKKTENPFLLKDSEMDLKNFLKEDQTQAPLRQNDDSPLKLSTTRDNLINLPGLLEKKVPVLQARKSEEAENKEEFSDLKQEIHDAYRYFFKSETSILSGFRRPPLPGNL